MTEPAPQTYPICPMRRLDAYPEYAGLRADDELPKVQMPYGEPTWLTVKHEDVRAFLMDPLFSRADGVGKSAPGFSPNGFGRSIPFMDAPEHTEARRLLARGLGKKRAESLRPRMQQIVDRLIDAMLAKGAPADLVADFARPLPLAVNCELYGVPEEDREQFEAWSTSLMAGAGRPPEEMMAGGRGLMEYTATMITRRRREPGDDLVSALVQAWDQHGGFTDQELVQAVLTLLLGGLDPVTAHIANSMFILLQNREQYALLKSRPEIAPTAVEELLRFVSIGDVFGFGSYASQDTKLGATTVQAGEPVLALLASANRDAAVFTEPDRLDLTREINPHVSFGHGPHYCAGAALARVELQLAYTTLAARMPELRLVEQDQHDWWYPKVTVIRTFHRLPVEW